MATGTALATKAEAMRLDVRETRVEERQRRCARTLRAELGPAILSALDDPDVVEIIVNPPKLGASDCAIWTESLREGMRDTRTRMQKQGAYWEERSGSDGGSGVTPG